MSPAATAPWRAQFVALAAIWGSSFLCIKVLAEDLAPVHVALLRTALGAAFLVAVVVLRGLAVPRDRAALGHLAVVALLMNALPFTLFAYGEQHVTSVLAGLWNATTPLWTLLVVLIALPGERPGRRGLGALAGGFVGVVVLLGPWRGLGGDDLLGQLACAAAALCYGLGVPYTRRHLSARPEGGVALAAVQLVLATAMLGLAAPLGGVPQAAIGADGIAAALVLGVLGSGVAYVLMHAIIRAAGPTTMSTVTYAIPVVSTLLGVVVLSEGVSANEPIGAAIVLAVLWWSSRPARAPATSTHATARA